MPRTARASFARQMRMLCWESSVALDGLCAIVPTENGDGDRTVAGPICTSLKKFLDGDYMHIDALIRLEAEGGPLPEGDIRVSQVAPLTTPKRFGRWPGRSRRRTGSCANHSLSCTDTNRGVAHPCIITGAGIHRRCRNFVFTQC